MHKPCHHDKVANLGGVSAVLLHLEIMIITHVSVIDTLSQCRQYGRHMCASME